MSPFTALKTGWLQWLLLCVLSGTSLMVGAADGQQPRARDRSGLAALLGSDDDAGLTKAIAPRTFMFPEDHGPHPSFRNEWWYMTGNLDAADGRRFGFELTIFRFSLSKDAPQADSNWRTNQVYIAHFAVTDVDGKRFYTAERFSRGALGLAGAQAAPFRVWIDNWSLSAAGSDGTASRWALQAADEDFALTLALSAEKPVALNGEAGLSRKSAAPGNASYYYTVSRWQAAGRIRIGSESLAVTGLTWLDREWSSSALAADQVGWDWFALQLSEGSDLMFYSLRRADGSRDAFSAGTFIAADGSARAINASEVELTVLEFWDSPRGGRYPSAWRMRVPEYELELEIMPVMKNQELFTTVRYWEGAVDVTGRRADQPITGRGYVELTGYAE